MQFGQESQEQVLRAILRQHFSNKILVYQQEIGVSKI